MLSVKTSESVRDVPPTLDKRGTNVRTLRGPKGWETDIVTRTESGFVLHRQIGIEGWGEGFKLPKEIIDCTEKEQSIVCNCKVQRHWYFKQGKIQRGGCYCCSDY